MYYEYHPSGKLYEIDSMHHYVEGDKFPSKFTEAFYISPAGWRDPDGMVIYL
jgi:hypothetical protein